MVSLTRSQKAAFGSGISKQAPPEIVISKIFHHSFELVAEVLAVISGSPQRAESIVARSLTLMADPKLTDEPVRNLARLRARSVEMMSGEWVPRPTPEELRHSPLALIQSLPFEHAVAYVLHNFSGLEPMEIGPALGATEAGAKVQLKHATEAINSRLQQKVDRDLVKVFKSEAEIVANQVFADPEILVQILLDLATQRDEPTTTTRRSRWRSRA